MRPNAPLETNPTQSPYGSQQINNSTIAKSIPIMTYQNTTQASEFEIVPGFYGRVFQGEDMTVVHVRIEKGSQLPEHRHPNEQITSVLSGELEMVVGGEKKVCTAGDVVVIPGNVAHSGYAHSDCRVIDVFRPKREF